MARRLLRSAVKAAVLRVLGSGPVVSRKIARIRSTGSLTILNLHRVAPYDRSTYPPLAPELFDYLLAFLAPRFEITTFAGLTEPARGERPRLILSFDDAYKDFADYAAPIMARHGVRANLNVIPACIEKAEPPLNVVLNDFVGRAPAKLLEEFEVPGFPQWRAGASRDEHGGRLAAFVKDKPMAEQRALEPALRAQIARDEQFRPTPMMSREEVREAGRVHEIGGHSFEHANIGCESDDYLRADVAACRRYFSEELDLPLSIYALPNGSHRPGQIELLRQEGLKQILLVGEDFSSEGGDVHTRFTFDARSRAEARFRGTGAYSWPKGPGR